MSRIVFSFVALILCVPLGTSGDPKTKDAKSIQGNWQVVTFILEGRERKGDDIKDLYFKISATEIAIVQGKKPVVPPRAYSTDGTKSPKHIDFVDFIYTNKKADKDSKERFKTTKEKLVMPGIYDLDNDTLKICWNGEGVPPEKLERPKDFKVAANESYVILKRQK